MIKIDQECCDLCGTCVSVCPVDCMELKEAMLVIDNSRCNSCQICVRMCPFKALELVD
ncbi:MAG: 4Fe-4S binding protein [Candidatus Marinimicrobia bacterium]|jgi:NAD-dependent dihydropyrimidine dehydrogenase PreA subunit|nr:4Fe-4S binding protein [Candidatus Neomarinimicrobiota bacterium]MCK9483682.1 4Fe-4S binding protein [Candidatus Neomarinimicrobiota bacterium]MCK9558878.1 4Fe-4S binding protein [Candidatus Neomarinimicrobiota bacterium]